MKTSEAGIKLIEDMEGLRLNAYQDVAGVWTNGYGNTHGVIPGSTITAAQAESDLLSNVAGSEYVVNTVVKVQLNQNQFDALVDFVFNLGSGNFQSSTLLRLLNQGNYAQAANEFPKWNHAGGVVVAGLTTRRLAEQAMFNSTAAPAVTNVNPVTEQTAEQTVENVVQGVQSFFGDLENKLGS
jgi:lysozyme